MEKKTHNTNFFPSWRIILVRPFWKGVPQPQDLVTNHGYSPLTSLLGWSLQVHHPQPFRALQLPRLGVLQRQANLAPTDGWMAGWPDGWGLKKWMDGWGGWLQFTTKDNWLLRKLLQKCFEAYCEIKFLFCRVSFLGVRNKNLRFFFGGDDSKWIWFPM